MSDTIEKKVTMADMSDMVDQDLLRHIETAINHFEKNVTVSAVEMTLAAGLAMEMGQSCNNEDELMGNIEAYCAFIVNLAAKTLELRKTSVQ